MAFDWPTYDREALEHGQTFSATYESFNQYMDEAYYTVTIHDGAHDRAPFTVIVHMGWVGDGNWQKPDFAPKLRDQIVLLAKDGKRNAPDATPTFRF